MFRLLLGHALLSVVLFLRQPDKENLQLNFFGLNNYLLQNKKKFTMFKQNTLTKNIASILLALCLLTGR